MRKGGALQHGGSFGRTCRPTGVAAWVVAGLAPSSCSFWLPCGLRVLTQRVHPANPSIMQSCDIPRLCINAWVRTAKDTRNDIKVFVLLWRVVDRRAASHWQHHGGLLQPTIVQAGRLCHPFGHARKAQCVVVSA